MERTMDRMVGRMLWRRPRSLVAFVVLTLAAAACSGAEVADGPEVEVPPVSAPGPAPAPPPSDAPAVPPVGSVPMVREGELAEVLIVEGWHPYEVFAGGFNPWPEGAAIDVMAWLDQLLPARPTPVGAVRIDVDVAVEREPAPCFAFHRPVTAVRVDVPGGGAAVIGSQVLAVAERASARIDDLRWSVEARVPPGWAAPRRSYCMAPAGESSLRVRLRGHGRPPDRASPTQARRSRKGESPNCG